MALSVLVHVLLIVILLNEYFLWGRLQAPTPEIAVELVPAPVPPPKADQPKPPPKPMPQPVPRPVPHPTQVVPPPPVPQLTPGRLAEHSTSPTHAGSGGAEGTSHAPLMAAGAAFSLTPKEQAKAGHAGAKGPEGPELTQSEHDFILSQIMKYWHVDFHSPEAHGLVLQGVIYINADGTLASPLNKNDPWDPSAVVADYASMVRAGYTFRREAIEGFLLALRLSQPLKLPPTGPWPRRMVFNFAFDDL